MKRLRGYILLIWVWGFWGVFGLSAQIATDLFISEYVEGTSFNKAIEVYNGTGTVVELSAYTIELYRGGETEWDRQAHLSDFQFELEDGETLVLRNSQSTTIGFQSSVVGFTGDDAIVLSKEGVIIDVVGVIGSSENSLPNTTLRRVEAVLSPRIDYKASEWANYDVDTFNGLGFHQIRNPDPEPSAQVTDLEVQQTDVRRFELIWTDAVGDQLPRGYYVLVSEENVVLPMDGIPMLEDRDLNDGSAVYPVDYGTEALVIDGLSSDTLYYIRVIPYSNKGELIDYNTQGTLGSGMVSVRSNPYVLSESFDALGDWQVVTRKGEREWDLVDGAVEANAFGSIGPADDWLVSPLIDFDSLEELVMRFEAKVAFNDLGFDPALTIWVSTDYSGVETEWRQADWELVDVPLPQEGIDEMVKTPNISLRAYSGNGYIAFRYESSGVGLNYTEGWTIDNLYLFSSSETAPLIELTFEPESVIETDGMESIVGTVKLSEAVEDVVEVNLLNGDETLLEMPETLTFLKGASEVLFLIDISAGLNLNTAEIVQIRARADGYIGGAGKIEIVPAAQRFLTTAINVSAVDEGSVGMAQLEVTLSRAPDSYPYSVMIVSSDLTEIEVDSPLRFEAGDGLTKIIGLKAVADGVFDIDEAVSITVTSVEYGSDISTLWVRNVDDPPPLFLDVSSTLVFENEGVLEGLITLGADPIQGYPVEVEIEVSDLTELGLPREVITIDSSDERKAVFSLPIRLDNEVDGTQTVEIEATLLNFTSDSVMVEVWDIDQQAKPSVIALRIEPTAIDEGESALGTIILSRSIAEMLEITLINGNPLKLSVPETVTIPEGQSFIQFTVQALDDFVIDGDEEVTVSALAENWVGGSDSVMVLNDDVVRVLSLSLNDTVLIEGSSTLATLSVNRSSEEDLFFEVGKSDDIEVPEGVLIPSGNLASSFMVEVIDADGWEGDESVTIRVYGSGHEGVEASLSILESESRVVLMKPERHDHFAAGQMIAMEGSVNGDLSSIREVVFMVDSVAVESTFKYPFVGHYSIPLSVVDGTRLTIWAEVMEEDGTVYQSGEVEVAVRFNPVLNESDFIRQIYADTLGKPISESRYAEYSRLLARTENRDLICERLFEENRMTLVEDAMALFYLVNGTLPSRKDLYETSLTESGLLNDTLTYQGIQLPPIIEYMEAGESTSFGDSEMELRGGFLGLIQVVLAFGNNQGFSELTHTEWFQALWRMRHGETPTAQQTLQANTRIQQFMTEQTTPFVEVDPLLYSRSRLLMSLIEEETFSFGTDVIFNPPNGLWKDYVRAAIIVLMGWSENEWIGTADGLKGIVGMSDEQQYDAVFSHPYYWNRFDYHWLGSRRDDFESRWRESDWFGWLAYDADDWPWVYHWNHGWIYGGNDNQANATKGVWYYDVSFGWVWTSGLIYPWMYSLKEVDWVYYEKGSGNPRWFYHTKTEEWQAEGA